MLVYLENVDTINENKSSFIKIYIYKVLVKVILHAIRNIDFVPKRRLNKVSYANL